MKTKLIADIGSNWVDGNFNPVGGAQLAVEAAVKAGFDMVKFQHLTAKELYGVHVAGLTEFPLEVVMVAASTAKNAGIEFGCTAFSANGYEDLNSLVQRHKVASSEAVHLDILRAVAKIEKPIIVSTGGLTEMEIAQVMRELEGCAVTLLECVSNYPADLGDYNLSVLGEWRKKYRCKVGISDHCKGKAALAGIALGVDVVEVHFDPFDTDGPDGSRHGFSLTPAEAAEFVSTARALERAVTSRAKDHANQHDAVAKYKRRVKAIADIKPGEKLVYGVNYGVYRSIEPDLHAAHAMTAEMYNGKVAKKALKPQDGIYVTDVQ